MEDLWDLFVEALYEKDLERAGYTIETPNFDRLENLFYDVREYKIKSAVWKIDTLIPNALTGYAILETVPNGRITELFVEIATMSLIWSVSFYYYVLAKKAKKELEQKDIVDKKTMKEIRFYYKAARDG